MICSKERLVWPIDNFPKVCYATVAMSNKERSVWKRRNGDIWCRRCKQKLIKIVRNGTVFYCNQNHKRHPLNLCPLDAIHKSYIKQAGYRVIYAPESPEATTNGWGYEQRIVMAQHLQRALLSSEVVHHKDGNRLNNNLSNLLLTTVSRHIRSHIGNFNHRQENETNPLIICACGCGQTLLKYDNRGRPRQVKHGHSKRWRQRERSAVII